MADSSSSTFAFKALDLAGVQTRGEVDAEDKQSVAAQLRARGLIVLDIEEKKSAADVGDFLTRFKRVKAQELTVATRQLSTMISSGMSLLRALYVLEEQVENDKFREALTAVRVDVEAGISFAEALAKHPKIFNDLYVAMVQAGETGGILEETLKRVADQLEKDDSLRRQIKAAMMYPAMIGGFALLVLVALVVFLVPVFEGIFKDFGGDLPAITKFTVMLSDLMTQRWYVVIAAAVGTVYLFRKWKGSVRGREQWDRFKLRIPWQIGSIVQKVCLARFSRTYSALIAAGVPMLQAIEITGKTAGNKVVEKAMDGVRDSVKAGGSIAAPMRNEPTAFPSMVVQMIAVGEETGALESMLAKIADFYEDEVAAALKALTSILEPLMIILVGAIVGFIVVSMYLPMFKVYDQIR
jgi:type IV pilus assembly protein PilC